MGRFTIVNTNAIIGNINAQEIEDSETYFLSFNTKKKILNPMIVNTQFVQNIIAANELTPLPPLN